MAVLPFWISIAVLSLVQGAVVALPRALARSAACARSASRRWALIPPLSVIGFVLIAGAAERASAAGAHLPRARRACRCWRRSRSAGSSRGARPRAALLVPPLFALAWVDRGGLAGEAAATLALRRSAASRSGRCSRRSRPPRWLAAGIVAMAIADTALVVSDLLQRPNNALNAAHPAAGLPRLQSAVFGSAVMGYGDLFVAGVLGGLLAVALGPARVSCAGPRSTALLALALRPAVLRSSTSCRRRCRWRSR